MNPKVKYGLFALISAIFGSTFLAIGLGLRAGATPLFYAGLRFALAGAILTGMLALSGRLRLGPQASESVGAGPVGAGSVGPAGTARRVLSLLARSAILSLGLTVGTFGLMFLAQTQVDSGLMARLDATGPLLTALFAAILVGKRLGPAHILAFALGTGGAFLITGPSTGAEPAFLAAAAGSVLFYAAGNAIYPRLFQQGEDPILVNALQSLIGGIILLVLAFLTEEVAMPVEALWPLAYLVIIGSVLGHSVMLVLVRSAGPVFATGWLYVAPIMASVLGLLVLGEELTFSGIVGCVLALVGVFILGRAESKNSARQARGSAHLGDSGAEASLES